MVSVARHLCASAILLTLAGCAVNPATGERQFSLISEAQEIALGRAAREQIEQTIGFVDDAPLQAYVQRLGMQLARASERPKLPWTFAVVDDPTPNAFALPGGFIYITRGMMNLMDSEAELVTVLGHEIAHVTARHSVTQISRQQLAQLGLGIGGILFPEIQPFGQALSAGLDLLFLRYSREAEREADELGFRYAREQNYDVSEMADVFRSLQRIDTTGRSALPSWLATHPTPAERIAEVEERIKATPAPPSATLGRAEYLGQIDGLVYGEDPRQGYFRDGLFLHPALRFQLSLPEAWRAQNLARAVVGINEARNAAAQLTIAGTMPPATAAQQFFRQEGIRAVRTTRETINGIPAVVSTFEAATEQGPIAGYIAWIDYRDVTYQLATYTSAAALGRYGNTLQGIIRSFAPLTDREALTVQPRRIDIVRLPRNMSMREFAQVYPSVIPLETVAAINQVTNVDERIGAGTLLKRVVEGGR